MSSATERPEGIDVSELVRDLEPFLRRLLGPHTDLRLRLTRELPRIAGERASVEDAVTNLLLNARDAVPNDGAVTIESRSEESSVVVEVRRDRNRGAFAIAFAALPPGGHEAILVVEDDDSLLALATTVLRRQGYDVTSERDAGHAFEVAAARDIPFDLLVTDVVMPVMSGPELARRLDAMGRPIPTLYMSGYTRDTTVRRGLVAATDSFLVKPFTPRLLLEQARAALDRQAKAGRAA